MSKETLNGRPEFDYQSEIDGFDGRYVLEVRNFASMTKAEKDSFDAEAMVLISDEFHGNRKISTETPIGVASDGQPNEYQDALWAVVRDQQTRQVVSVGFAGWYHNERQMPTIRDTPTSLENIGNTWTILDVVTRPEERGQKKYLGLSLCQKLVEEAIPEYLKKYMELSTDKDLKEKIKDGILFVTRFQSEKFRALFGNKIINSNLLEYSRIENSDIFPSDIIWLVATTRFDRSEDGTLFVDQDKPDVVMRFASNGLSQVDDGMYEIPELDKAGVFRRNIFWLGLIDALENPDILTKFLEMFLPDGFDGRPEWFYEGNYFEYRTNGIGAEYIRHQIEELRKQDLLNDRASAKEINISGRQFKGYNYYDVNSLVLAMKIKYPQL